MNQVCSSPSRWFYAYSPEHYTHYLKIKCLLEWAVGAYERVYVRIEESLSDEQIVDYFRDGDSSLRWAKQLIAEAKSYPAQLRHLMVIEQNFATEFCKTISEVITGNTDQEIRLFELNRILIAQRSQYVDEDDLDILLGRSSNAIAEFGQIDINSKFPGTTESNTIFERASRPLELDLDEMITQLKDWMGHMIIKNDEDRLIVNFIKVYDDRFAAQRKAIKFLRKFLKTVQSPENYTAGVDAEILSESESIPKEINTLDLGCSRLLQNLLLPESQKLFAT